MTFITETKRIKYLGIKLPKKAKDLYLRKLKIELSHDQSIPLLGT